MSTQRIAAQRIEVGPVGPALSRLDLAGPVLITGSARSAALLPWQALFDDVAVFNGSAAHNPMAVVRDACDRADEIGANTVIAIGSASALDLGKAVVEHHRGALVAVPTTLGGSEMTRVYGSRHDDGTKRGGAGQALLPGVVCYDPELLASLPSQMLAASGINAWAHAIEAHYGRREHWIGGSCASSAGHALPLLLREAAEGTRSEAVHQNLFEAACLAGFAMNARGMGLHHAICHVLGGLTGIGHAALNVAVLAAAVQTNARLAPRQIADMLADFRIDDVGVEIGKIATLYKLPATLRDLGVTAKQLEGAIPAVMAAHHLGNNPATPTEADVRQTLAAAFEGSALHV